MANRCPDCNKFVSLQPGEVECDGPLIDGHEISVGVRITLQCAECGADMKAAEFDMTPELPQDVQDHMSEFVESDDHEIEVDEPDDLEFTERCEGKGRRPKVFYGFTGTIRGKCSCGAAEFAIPISDDIQASNMEECT